MKTPNKDKNAPTEYFGSRFEPMGIGISHVRWCKNCHNGKCIAMSKDRYAYCEDYKTDKGK